MFRSLFLKHCLTIVVVEEKFKVGQLFDKLIRDVSDQKLPDNLTNYTEILFPYLIFYRRLEILIQS